MKKITLRSVQRVFLLLICSGIASKIYSQEIKAETFNFTELANREAAQSFQQHSEHEIDGGWRYLHRDMPFPAGAKIMRQSQAVTFSPNTVEAASPQPLQGFLGYIDPINVIPPDCDGTVGLNEVVTATNDFIIVHAKNGGAVLSKVTFSTFFNKHVRSVYAI